MSAFKDLINGEEPVLVDFTAEWCGPCKMMAPILKEMASTFKDKLKIIKVDVDKNQAAASFYNVQGVPTLILFRKGEIKWRESGVVPGHLLKGIIEKII